jgi:hypothetical protein
MEKKASKTKAKKIKYIGKKQQRMIKSIPGAHGIHGSA